MLREFYILKSYKIVKNIESYLTQKKELNYEVTEMINLYVLIFHDWNIYIYTARIHMNEPYSVSEPTLILTFKLFRLRFKKKHPSNLLFFPCIRPPLLLLFFYYYILPFLLVGKKNPQKYWNSVTRRALNKRQYTHINSPMVHWVNGAELPGFVPSDMTEIERKMGQYSRKCHDRGDEVK